MKNKSTLKKLSISEAAEKERLIDTNQLRHHIQSDVFWSKVEGFNKLLKPIADCIAVAESDTTSLSVAAKIFEELKETLKQGLSASPVLKSEEKSFMNIISERKFLIKDVHLAANMLDPNYRGCHLTKEEAVSNQCNFINC